MALIQTALIQTALIQTALIQTALPGPDTGWTLPRANDARGGEMGGVVTETQPGTQPETQPETQPKTRSRRTWLSPMASKLLRIAVSLVLLGFIVWFVFRQFTDLSAVLRVIGTLTWRESGVLAAAAAWNLVTYWIVVVVATPGLTLAQAGVLTQATTAVSNAVPAGGAVAVGLTYSMLSSWGFSRSRSTLSVVVTGIWNNFIKLGMPVLALALLALQGRSGAGRTVAALAGLGGLVGAVVVFALILRSEDFARKAGIVAGRCASVLLRLVRRGPVSGWDLAVTKWRNRVIGLVRHRWLALTVSALVSHFSLYAVLLVTLRVMGVSESAAGWAEVLAVFAFARLVTAIPLTPGGVGVVELALIAGLTTAGGNGANVVAAVLLYRILTYVLPIVVGAGAYVFWRRNHSWRDSAPPLDVALASVEHRHGPQPAAAMPEADAVARNRERPKLVIRRRRVDLLWLTVGLVVFLFTAAVARGGLAPGEAALFQAVNGLPDALRPVIWPFMQYGVFLTIPVLSLVALLLRRVRLAVAMALAGVGVYVLARVVKQVVERGRPGALVEDVVARETFAVGSLGFPSGHAAVAGALTVVVTPYLPGRWKILPAALLVIVALGRMYVAAHVPLDLLGGAALGATAGAIASLLVGVPSRTPAGSLSQAR
jgi:putative heme transporter